MATVTEKTAKLEASILAKSKQLAQLKLQKAKLNHQDKGAKKKEDTRRKILAGAIFLSKFTDAASLAVLHDSLIRADDRALFGLAPLPKLEV